MRHSLGVGRTGWSFNGLNVVWLKILAVDVSESGPRDEARVELVRDVFGLRMAPATEETFHVPAAMPRHQVVLHRSAPLPLVQAPQPEFRLPTWHRVQIPAPRCALVCTPQRWSRRGGLSRPKGCHSPRQESGAIAGFGDPSLEELTATSDHSQSQSLLQNPP